MIRSGRFATPISTPSAEESLIASDPTGATVIEIDADEDNHEAAKLYRRLGYALSGDERGSNGERIHLFRRRIH